MTLGTDGDQSVPAKHFPARYATQTAARPDQSKTTNLCEGYGSLVSEYHHDCPVDDHAEMAARQFGPKDARYAAD